MQAMSSNWGDVRKYYEQAYIKLREFGEMVVFVDRVRPDAIYFTTEQQDEGIVYLHNDAPYEINMSLPHKAMFQRGNNAYLMFRLPQRQYHKGITSNNCQIRKLTSKGWSNVPLSFGLLNGYTNKPNYRDLDVVIQDASVESEALAPRWAFCQGKIYLDERQVGTTFVGARKIIVNELFIPEVNKLLAPNSIFKVSAK